MLFSNSCRPVTSAIYEDTTGKAVIAVRLYVCMYLYVFMCVCACVCFGYVCACELCVFKKLLGERCYIVCGSKTTRIICLK